jgi:deoxyribose-phosphate aldolase
MVGFPLGAMDSDAKRFETECAIDGGAHEIDVVVNAGWIKDGLDKLVFRELRDIVEAAEERPVKAAIQTSLLTDDEKVRVCELAARAGARFVATGPGTAGSPVSPLDVAPLRKAAGQTLGIKAQGGIRDAQTALALIDAGATRIGSSAAAALLEGAPKQSGNDASGR